MSDLAKDPIIVTMAQYLRRRLALTTADFCWTTCAPGFLREYRIRGGIGHTELEVAEAIHDVLEHIEEINPLGVQRGRKRMTENQGIVPDRVRHVCRWEPLTAWARRIEGEIVVTEVECASCHNKVSVETAHTTIAVGEHGDDLPLPGFIHCTPCMLRMEPTTAWYLASAEAKGEIGRRD